MMWLLGCICWSLWPFMEWQLQEPSCQWGWTIAQESNPFQALGLTP